MHHIGNARPAILDRPVIRSIDGRMTELGRQHKRETARLAMNAKLKRAIAISHLAQIASAITFTLFVTRLAAMKGITWQMNPMDMVMVASIVMVPVAFMAGAAMFSLEVADRLDNG